MQLTCVSQKILPYGIQGICTTFDDGQLPIGVGTPWNFANDLLRNFMIKTLIEYLKSGSAAETILLMVVVEVAASHCVTFRTDVVL